jgi:integrase/ribosomal protein L40E
MGLYYPQGNVRRSVKQSALLHDPDGYLASWPPHLYREEVEKFYAWLKARKAYSPNTLYRYLSIFKGVLERLGKNPREIALEDILRLQPDEADAKVLKLYLRYLSEVTEDERWEKLYKRVRIPQGKKKLPEALTREQVDRLLEACGKVSFELKVLVALIYETGARVGEILWLKARDIEFDQYGARVWIRRSKSEARVLRVALYANLLATWLEARKPEPEEPVFPHDYTTYYNWLRKAWQLANLPETKRMFHILRHTRATELLRSRTFTEKEMMLWFGWRKRDMIDVYAKVTMSDVEASYLAAVKGVDLKKEEPPKPKACPRCGALNPPDASFCLKCAAPLTPEAEKQASNLELLLQRLIAEVEELKRVKKPVKE